MKFIVENWILILVAFVSGGMLVWPMVRKGGGGGSVPTSEAVRLINREKGVLVDVGEPDEYAAGHAAGARNVPFGQIEGSKDLPSNKALPLLVMCPTGARAARAAAALRKAGYERAVAVGGGTAAWREAQLPIERSEAGKPTGKPSDKTADKTADKATEKSA
ncbi:MAG: rhodanese-like domain-containing protein [Burkholderiales bacterium]|nr:rhodanese-like domain-containing protein [Burkholderiales bacterium]